MAIGERIRFIRDFRAITQKWLGMAVGFPEKTADIRMSQYERGTRAPKKELTEKFAEILGVSPAALDVPNIDTPNGVMHMLFALEDLYGLQIDEMDGKIVLMLRNNKENKNLRLAFRKWLNKTLMLRNGDISREKYNDWRYNFSVF